MRILTGLQPSGKLHVGNYFGAIKPAIDAQGEGDGYYFIADYHAMTTTHDSNELRENVRNVAIDFLACGFDPSRGVFFKQSSVPEVNELAWILSTVCPMGLLERCHSYKDKISKGISANHALFAYPALMAADILLYDSNVVPVGEDQKQYGEGTLMMPKARIRDDVAKVPGLDGEKMSKSYNNTLPIFGDEKPTKKLIMRIKTDSAAVEDPKPTENSIILALYQLFADQAEYGQMISDYENGGCGYGDFKKRLAEAYWDYFAPMRARREELVANSDEVDSVLKAGAEKARSEAAKVLDRVRKAVGLA
jgi:tryptophanyl-tRNA synthetase